ncbi:Glyoxalase/bleomycin resistance protein/dioxygenase [Isosphaera pallida ATCC 43644]|uniref:Glyoxalase/bleomycin resistance protein/dioxygenase n=1 Tax=Isosphaera pallida (strain ATCC 43644 / DSM 9630 / IS1B) TaxID=575540 RepID=E8R205_ISOPI|nr:VOC family protein [Isosphaera pallida]ADV62437.1 Glyoxalase/bleomycin resistance protein/dioxygenase [Isosphaera pallida ATCC 43644]
MIPSRIEHVALFADDAPALRAFYETRFGMRTVLEHPGDPPGYFLADDQGQAIEIIGKPPGVEPVNPRYVCHLAFRVALEDYEPSRRQLRDDGLQFEEGTEVDTDAMKTFFFFDPAGNRIQIVWRRNPLV